MNNEYNRYCLKIRAILGINSKMIHKELATASISKTPLDTTVTERANCFGEEREDVNDDPRSASPLSEMKILN